MTKIWSIQRQRLSLKINCIKIGLKIVHFTIIIHSFGEVPKKKFAKIHPFMKKIVHLWPKIETLHPVSFFAENIPLQYTHGLGAKV